MTPVALGTRVRVALGANVRPPSMRQVCHVWWVAFIGHHEATPSHEPHQGRGDDQNEKPFEAIHGYLPFSLNYR